MVTKPLEIKVDLPNLMRQAVMEMKSLGVAVGFQVSLSRLNKIALRAIEIEDNVILNELKALCLITEKSEVEEVK